jgi:hypothetical protein
LASLGEKLGEGGPSNLLIQKSLKATARLSKRSISMQSGLRSLLTA